MSVLHALEWNLRRIYQSEGHLRLDIWINYVNKLFT